jgi:hypothetical protein
MPRSRNPTWLIDPERQTPGMTDLVQFTTQQRINLPARLLKGLEWLEKPEATGEILALMKLDEPGRLSLLSWRLHSPAVLQRRQELVERAEDEQEALEALILLDDRYFRIQIERTGRLLLPLPALAHLYGEGAFYHPLYVVRARDRIELWSQTYRNQRISVSSHLLEDLP